MGLSIKNSLIRFLKLESFIDLSASRAELLLKYRDQVTSILFNGKIIKLDRKPENPSNVAFKDIFFVIKIYNK